MISGVFFYDGRARRRRYLFCRQLLPADRAPPFYQQLPHEARHLSAVDSVGSGVVHQRDLIRPLDHAVEIIGIYGNLVVDGCQAERFAQVVGDKRGLPSAFWEAALR